MDDGGHHLRKAPNPQPNESIKAWNLCQRLHSYTNYYICIKFGSSSIKNGPSNAKKDQITN